jgi:hypothetical protein
MIILITPLILRGCSDNRDEKIEDHVRKKLNDPIKKAGEVNQLVPDTVEKQRQNIDQQTQ